MKSIIFIFGLLLFLPLSAHAALTEEGVYRIEFERAIHIVHEVLAGVTLSASDKAIIIAQLAELADDPVFLDSLSEVPVEVVSHEKPKKTFGTKR